MDIVVHHCPWYNSLYRRIIEYEEQEPIVADVACGCGWDIGPHNCEYLTRFPSYLLYTWDERE